MFKLNIDSISTEGLQVLLTEKINIELNQREQIDKLKKLYERQYELRKEAQKIDADILLTFSDIANGNAKLDAIQKGMANLVTPGLNISEKV